MGSIKILYTRTGLVMFFTLCRMVGAGVTIEQVERELERRSLKVTRRE